MVPAPPPATDAIEVTGPAAGRYEPPREPPLREAGHPCAMCGRRPKSRIIVAYPMAPAAPRYRSKTIAAWLALLAGALGLHRMYLRGLHDPLAWLHVVPTGAGLLGVVRMASLGQDDRLAWLLIPLLGLMISQAMLHAIVYALTPDEAWDARHNPGHPVTPTRWAPVLAAIAALMIGGAVLMGTLTFAIQRFFEWQMQSAEGRTPGGSKGVRPAPTG